MFVFYSPVVPRLAIRLPARDVLRGYLTQLPIKELARTCADALVCQRVFVARIPVQEYATGRETPVLDYRAGIAGNFAIAARFESMSGCIYSLFISSDECPINSCRISVGTPAFASAELKL